MAETLLDVLRNNRNPSIRISVNTGSGIPFNVRYDESDNTFKYWSNNAYRQKITLQGGLFDIPADDCIVIHDKIFKVGDQVVFDGIILHQTITYTTKEELKNYKFLTSDKTENNPIGRIIDAKIDDDGCLYYTIEIPKFSNTIIIGNTMLSKMCSKIVD